MAKKAKTIADWSRQHKADKKYRKAQAEGSRRHLEQLYRDAELGRMARVVLAGIAEILKKIAEEGAER